MITTAFSMNPRCPPIILRLVTGGRSSHSASVSSSLSTGSLATGNILKGAGPVDLPVIVSTELID
jgi:hypothetical protein